MHIYQIVYVYIFKELQLREEPRKSIYVYLISLPSWGPVARSSRVYICIYMYIYI